MACELKSRSYWLIVNRYSSALTGFRLDKSRTGPPTPSTFIEFPSMLKLPPSIFTARPDDVTGRRDKRLRRGRRGCAFLMIRKTSNAQRPTPNVEFRTSARRSPRANLAARSLFWCRANIRGRQYIWTYGHAVKRLRVPPVFP